MIVLRVVFEGSVSPTFVRVRVMFGVLHGVVYDADVESWEVVVSIKDDGVDWFTEATFLITERRRAPGDVELLLKPRLVEYALSTTNCVKHVGDGVGERLTSVSLRTKRHHGGWCGVVLRSGRCLHVTEHGLLHNSVLETQSRDQGLKEAVPGLNGFTDVDYTCREPDVSSAVLVVVESDSKRCVTGKSAKTVESGCPFSHDVEINRTNCIDDVHKKLVLVPVSVLKCVDSEEGIVGT